MGSYQQQNSYNFQPSTLFSQSYQQQPKLQQQNKQQVFQQQQFQLQQPQQQQQHFSEAKTGSGIYDTNQNQSYQQHYIEEESHDSSNINNYTGDNYAAEQRHEYAQNNNYMSSPQIQQGENIYFQPPYNNLRQLNLKNFQGNNQLQEQQMQEQFDQQEAYEQQQQQFQKLQEYPNGNVEIQQGQYQQQHNLQGNDKDDSLISQVVFKNPLEGFDDLFEEISRNFRENKVSDALDLCEQTIYQSHRARGPASFNRLFQQIMKFLNNEGINALNQNLFEKSLLILIKSQELTELPIFSSPPPIKALTLNNFGCYYRRLSQLPKALGYLEQALRFLNSIKSREYLGKTYLNISAILSQMGEHYASLENAKKAVIEIHKDYQQYLGRRPLEHALKDQDFVDICQAMAIAFYNIGVEQEHFQNHEICLINYGKACEVAKDNLGENHRLTKRFRELFQQYSEKLLKQDMQKNYSGKLFSSNRRLTSRPISGISKVSQRGTSYGEETRENTSDRENSKQITGSMHKSSLNIKFNNELRMTTYRSTTPSRSLTAKKQVSVYSFRPKSSRQFPEQVQFLSRPVSAKNSPYSAGFSKSSLQPPKLFLATQQRPMSAQAFTKSLAKFSPKKQINQNRPDNKAANKKQRPFSEKEEATENIYDWVESPSQQSEENLAKRIGSNQNDFLKGVQKEAEIMMKRLQQEEQEVKDRIKKLREEADKEERRKIEERERQQREFIQEQKRNQQQEAKKEEERQREQERKMMLKREEEEKQRNLILQEENQKEELRKKLEQERQEKQQLLKQYQKSKDSEKIKEQVVKENEKLKQEKEELMKLIEELSKKIGSPPNEKAQTPPNQRVVTPPNEKAQTPPHKKTVSPPNERAQTPPEKRVVAQSNERVLTPPNERVVTQSDESRREIDNLDKQNTSNENIISGDYDFCLKIANDYLENIYSIYGFAHHFLSSIEEKVISQLQFQTSQDHQHSIESSRPQFSIHDKQSGYSSSSESYHKREESDVSMNERINQTQLNQEISQKEQTNQSIQEVQTFSPRIETRKAQENNSKQPTDKSGYESDQSEERVTKENVSRQQIQNTGSMGAQNEQYQEQEEEEEKQMQEEEEKQIEEEKENEDKDLEQAVLLIQKIFISKQQKKAAGVAKNKKEQLMIQLFIDLEGEKIIFELLKVKSKITNKYFFSFENLLKKPLRWKVKRSLPQFLGDFIINNFKQKSTLFTPFTFFEVKKKDKIKVNLSQLSLQLAATYLSQTYKNSYLRIFSRTQLIGSSKVLITLQKRIFMRQGDVYAVKLEDLKNLKKQNVCQIDNRLGNTLKSQNHNESFSFLSEFDVDLKKYQISPKQKPQKYQLNPQQQQQQQQEVNSSNKAQQIILEITKAFNINRNKETKRISAIFITSQRNLVFQDTKQQLTPLLIELKQEQEDNDIEQVATDIMEIIYIVSNQIKCASIIQIQAILNLQRLFREEIVIKKQQFQLRINDSNGNIQFIQGECSFTKKLCVYSILLWKIEDEYNEDSVRNLQQNIKIGRLSKEHKQILLVNFQSIVNSNIAIENERLVFDDQSIFTNPDELIVQRMIFN